MCGLAGFARHPNAAHLDKAVAVAETMMRRIRHRGHHATGLATVGGASPFLWKWARPVTDALASDAWRQQRQSIVQDTLVLLGHVRYATHNNGHLDEAAHPFRMGQVCGAHNGVIRNWIDLAREFETEPRWIVDSQAAFALLDRFDDPADALRLLDGYWALTWTKNGKLNAVRSEGAPLAMAYVPAMRTLFWCSEMNVLRDALRNEGGLSATDYDSWEIRTGVVYSYDPTLFDAEGSHATRTEVEFTNRRNGKVDARTNGQQPARGGGATWPSAGQEWRTQGGFSTRTTRDPFEDEGEQLALGRRGKPAKGSGGGRGSAGDARRRTEDLDTSAGVSLKGLANVVQRLAGRLTEAELKVGHLEAENGLLAGRLQAAEAEIEYLYEVLNEAGIMGLDLDAEAEAESAGAKEEEPPHRCRVCGKGERDQYGIPSSEMVPDGDGYVHTACLFQAGAQPAEGTDLIVGMV